MPGTVLPYHREAGAFVPAPPEQVFDYLDDPRRLAGHIKRSSAIMLGSRMGLEVDQAAGRAIGSTIRMAGRLLGIRLLLEDVITEREPPSRKVWHTIGRPRLLVLTQYRMGFEVVLHGSGSQLRVFIDYQRPERGLARALGWLFGAFYARWCTRRMVREAVKYFRPRVSLQRRAPAWGVLILQGRFIVPSGPGGYPDDPRCVPTSLFLSCFLASLCWIRSAAVTGCGSSSGSRLERSSSWPIAGG